MKPNRKLIKRANELENVTNGPVIHKGSPQVSHMYCALQPQL